MVPRFCEVALAVPLRTTFTYAVPDSLAEVVVAGSRVVVPFRNRALVGVALGLTDRQPEVEQIKEIVEVLDPIPALPPRLIELGCWVASYYLAPPGEEIGRASCRERGVELGGRLTGQKEKNRTNSM